MNSRGTLMIHRTSGETLATNDNVAMIPTVQPARAGTHENRVVGRVAVAVITREDIRSAAWAGLPWWPGVLFARTVSRVIGDGAVLAEGILQAPQPVTQRGGVRAEVLRGRRHQPRQSGDQSAGLVEVAMRTRFRIP